MAGSNQVWANGMSQEKLLGTTVFVLPFTTRMFLGHFLSHNHIGSSKMSQAAKLEVQRLKTTRNIMCRGVQTRRRPSNIRSG